MFNFLKHLGRRKHQASRTLPGVAKAMPGTPAVVRARYDAAQTTAENARHWAMADGLSADDAASPDVRRKLRERARYEVANNSYARGIVSTLANDCIGTGPRLQLLSEDGEANRLIEQAFADWARAVNLAEKLRTMRMAKATDGEAFAVMTANPNVDSPVMLDVRLIEADRVASPTMALLPAAGDIDGILLDGWGNPQSYTILRQHPGCLAGWPTQVDYLPADAVVHWFRSERPGQHRGIPEITAALPLFAQLRRYTLAVIAAAETAADFAAVLFTDAPANGEAQALEPMDVVELEKRMATVLPDGWRLGQIDAQQPSTGYAEFKREILNEIASGRQLPRFRRDASGWLQAAFSTTSLPGILSTIANKMLLEGYNYVEDAWRRIAKIASVNDFKEHTRYRMTGSFQFQQVGPDGELKHGQIGEQSFKQKADTHGIMFALTRQMIINDDMGAFTDIPRQIGMGAAEAIADAVWGLWLSNPEQADGQDFFSSAHNNYKAGADTALSVDSLTDAEVAFGKQVKPNGKPLGIPASLLLVPTALKVPAEMLMKSLLLNETTTANKGKPNTNPHVGKFDVVSSVYLSNSSFTGASSKAWYLMADPNRLPSIEVAFLNGVDRPTVEKTDADFNTLGVQFRGYIDFGVKEQDYRGALRMKGEA